MDRSLRQGDFCSWPRLQLMLIKAIQKEKEIPFIPPREQMSFLLNLGGTE